MNIISAINKLRVLWFSYSLLRRSYRSCPKPVCLHWMRKYWFNCSSWLSCISAILLQVIPERVLLYTTLITHAVTCPKPVCLHWMRKFWFNCSSWLSCISAILLQVIPERVLLYTTLITHAVTWSSSSTLTRGYAGWCAQKVQLAAWPRGMTKENAI